MKLTILQSLSVEQLVERFAEIGVEQDIALLGNQLSRFNGLFLEMQAIVEELKVRTGDRRRALVALYDHPNPQVRLKAVKATLAVEPELARNRLEAIARSKEFPQAGEAGMSISNLERGVYKPT